MNIGDQVRTFAPNPHAGWIGQIMKVDGSLVHVRWGTNRGWTAMNVADLRSAK